jgi:NADPH:quinone reductase-like Zn-dependent oxidoreductase
MRAFTLDTFDSPAAPRDLPEPDVGDNEVLVRVQGSSVNPVDVFVATGALKGMAEYEGSATRSSASCSTRTPPSTTGAGRS